MLAAVEILVFLLWLIFTIIVLAKFWILCSEVNDIHDRLFAGTEQDEQRWKPEPYEKDSQ